MRTLVNIPEVNHKLTMYKLGKCIAIGGFSKVYIVRSLYDGHFYAAKFMDRSRFPG